MNSDNRGLEDRSTSGGISSTNQLSPLLRTRGSGGILWRTLAKLDELHPQHPAIVNGSLQTPSSCAPRRIPSSATRRTHQDLLSPGPPATIRPVPTQPQSKHQDVCCHHTDGHERFNQAVRSHLLRYQVRVRSGFLAWLWWFRAIHSLPGEPGTRVLWMSSRDPRV